MSEILSPLFLHPSSECVFLSYWPQTKLAPLSSYNHYSTHYPPLFYLTVSRRVEETWQGAFTQILRKQV